MADLNRVFLIGRLTQDPELRHTSSGVPVTDLRIATSRVYNTKDGDRREETLFIDITVWNRQAENCCQYLVKGSQVHVEGFLKMETWDDRNTGEKRSKVKVEADRVQFLDSRRDSGGAPSSYDEGPARDSAPAPRRAPDAEFRGSNGSGAGRAPAPAAPRRPASPPPPTHDDGGDDDIPF